MTSFTPIIFNNAGKNAVAKFDFLPPYIDGSCRREPDFEQEYPAITGLCRPGFAAKLNIGDIVIYCTNQRGIGPRKVVAILQVIAKLNTHECAADWYFGQRLPFPSNLVTANSKPIPLDQTHNIRNFSDVTKWDAMYKYRATKYPIVTVCKKIQVELNNPTILDVEVMKSIFCRVPGTQNPSLINEEQWAKLKKYLGL